jgi:predicted alpha/beta hydrolase family esterase
MREKRQLLFVQGGGKDVHDEWDDKLVESLRRGLGDGFDVRYPRMPREDDPDYARWKPVLEEQIGELRDDAILVGHSVGATILVRLLQEQAGARRLGGLFFIAAPFLGDGGWSADDVRFSADLGARFPRDIPIHFYHGLEDKTVPSSHAELYGCAIPQARVHCLPGRDHQLDDDLSEVAEAILSLSPR